MSQPEATVSLNEEILTEQPLSEQSCKQIDKHPELHLKNPQVVSYFETFNAAQFQETAALFAPEGQLLPPFETALIGQAAIAEYLEAEAKGMKAIPQEAIEEELPSGDTQIRVLGQVQTALFSVNVRWEFVLNSQAKILTVKLKLLAALRDLLSLKR